MQLRLQLGFIARGFLREVALVGWGGGRGVRTSLPVQKSPLLYVYEIAR